MDNAPIMYYFEGGTIPDKFKERFKTYTKRQPSQGPAGLAGGLLIAPFSDVEVKYESNAYKWKKPAGTHIGILNNFNPVSIAKKQTVSGYKVKLGDGKEWIIPVALADTPRFGLPKYETIEEDGKWTWKVQEKYITMCQMAEKLWESVSSEGSFSLEESEVREICIMALQINYDITDLECSAMELFTQEAYKEMVEAIVDRPGAQEICAMIEGKKKRHAESVTGFGAKED